METLDPLETITFEDFQHEDGVIYWWASDLMVFLGYKDMKSFGKVIDYAIKSCIVSGIPYKEDFIPATRDKKGQPDYKLTRFACYLTVLNADQNQEAVAKAQVYFAAQTRKLEALMEDNPEEVERLLIRDEIKEGNKSLNSVAQDHGVKDFARFNNAGYKSLYNTLNVVLANKRRVDKTQLYDHMGRAELAANLFRITQTEERIKTKNVKGQKSLEDAHAEVGKAVRELVQKNTGKTPEQLPVERKLPEFRKELKKGTKKKTEADAPKTKGKKGK